VAPLRTIQASRLGLGALDAARVSRDRDDVLERRTSSASRSRKWLAVHRRQSLLDDQGKNGSAHGVGEAADGRSSGLGPWRPRPRVPDDVSEGLAGGAPVASSTSLLGREAMTGTRDGFGQNAGEPAPYLCWLTPPCSFF